MEHASVSLIITTYNRAQLLAEALRSVAECKKPACGGVEVIVVDNNSTDDTAAVVEKLSVGFPFPLRYVFEGKQGLSQARNRGAAESEAPIVAFMDDDQRLDEQFLARIEQELATTNADCIGGPIFYYNAENLPSWLPPLLENTGQYDGGREIRVLEPEGRKLNGGNMAFRKSVLQEIGGYNTQLGRNGRSLLASEEFELQDRLFAEGRKIVYTPNLIQYHYLRPERLTRKYWRRHHFDSGRTAFRRELASGRHQNSATLMGSPRWLWRTLIVKDIPSYVGAFFSESGESFDRQLCIVFRLGEIYEAQKSNKR